jgi:hypothetical protein
MTAGRALVRDGQAPHRTPRIDEELERLPATAESVDK